MAVLWMKTYMFYCSVRLGVLLISVFSFISLFVPSILFFAMGVDTFNPVLKLFTKAQNFREYAIVTKFKNMAENDSSKLMVLFQLYFFAHMIASVLAFYGALKIKKYLLLPFIVFELFRVIYCLVCHVLFMTIFKNTFNLGLLITSTLAGGFFALLLGYNWAACVALYQIITLINSERYKFLYGDDPFKPLIPKTYNPLVTENVRVLITPDIHDIDEQKKRNAIQKAFNKGNRLQPRPVVSVIPENYMQNNFNSNKYDEKWKTSKWPTTKIEAIPTPPPATHQLRNIGYGNNNDVNYGNWQWSELAAEVSAKNKRNIYAGFKWNN